MGSITTKDGTSIYYKDWGSGQPVVFSHGWPLNADAWDDQMLFVASHGYRAIAYDRRGHGRSSQPWNGNDMDTFADDLAALFEQLDMHDAVLVGHSAGGGDVARYIGRYGTARLAKVVLVDAIPPLLLKTESNPGGTPIEAFDGQRTALLADRSQFYKERISVLPSMVPIGRVPRCHKALWIPSGSGRCRQGSKGSLTASRPSPKPISPKTSSGSTFPP